MLGKGTNVVGSALLSLLREYTTVGQQRPQARVASVFLVRRVFLALILVLVMLRMDALFCPYPASVRGLPVRLSRAWSVPRAGLPGVVLSGMGVATEHTCLRASNEMRVCRRDKEMFSSFLGLFRVDRQDTVPRLRIMAETVLWFPGYLCSRIDFHVVYGGRREVCLHYADSAQKTAWFGSSV